MTTTIIEVEAGPRRGHKLWLRTDQSATVGRSELADFSLGEESKLAAIHFALEADRNSVHLTDLTGSDNTLVNGAPVTSQQIQYGDRIEAGNSRMRVRMQEDYVATVPARPSSCADETGYEAAVAANGLLYYAAQPSAPHAADVMRMLAGAYHRLLLVNPRKYSGSLPEHDRSNRQLPLADRAEDHQLIYDFDESIDVAQLIHDTWDHDAACCLLSSHRTGGTIKRLRYVAATYARPSLLRSQLTGAPLTIVAELMPEICGLLLPSGTASPWHVYGHPELAPSWKHLGLPDMLSGESASV